MISSLSPRKTCSERRLGAEDFFRSKDKDMVSDSYDTICDIDNFLTSAIGRYHNLSMMPITVSYPVP